MTGPVGVWATAFLDQAAGDPPTLTKEGKGGMGPLSAEADYTHSFVKHASAAGWEIPTLISQYCQGLKQDIQIALIVSHTSFTTVNKVASFSLELDTAMSRA
ncbi:hypothetical protein PTTG_26906 [Puccinia triticina 1-1 BBBD Race 1]|uniref:Uncharacterized protein n=1 Tax=Puccinia triticina (isolate 1-1 / race 1 (BBBD)) TaxID=630390 RepID=A0A180GQ96_PUCT1|nr:hypothetical protein PTTG_26906 [Puccinia triticina 1-1 BBBD Race 1]